MTARRVAQQRTDTSLKQAEAAHDRLEAAFNEYVRTTDVWHGREWLYKVLSQLQQSQRGRTPKWFMEKSGASLNR